VLCTECSLKFISEIFLLCNQSKNIKWSFLLFCFLTFGSATATLYRQLLNWTSLTPWCLNCTREGWSSVLTEQCSVFVRTLSSLQLAATSHSTSLRRPLVWKSLQSYLSEYLTIYSSTSNHSWANLWALEPTLVKLMQSNPTLLLSCCYPC